MLRSRRGGLPHNTLIELYNLILELISVIKCEVLYTLGSLAAAAGPRSKALKITFTHRQLLRSTTLFVCDR